VIMIKSALQFWLQCKPVYQFLPMSWVTNGGTTALVD
jgi:hypothetical protein